MLHAAVFLLHHRHFSEATHRWEVQTCCSCRLSAPEPPGSTAFLRSPTLLGRGKHAAAAAFLLQNRTQVVVHLDCLHARCCRASTPIIYMWHPRVLSLPIISCRRRPEHLSISSLPASSTSNFGFCMTNFGQLRELLFKSWRSSANTSRNSTIQHCCLSNHSRKMLLLIQIFCGTYIT